MNPTTSFDHEHKRIVIFTSNYQGGILQFAVHIAGVLSKLCYRVTLFAPDNAGDLEGIGSALEVHRYQRYKNIMPYNSESAELARKILALQPDRVFFCDDGIISTQTVLALRSAVQRSAVQRGAIQHSAVQRKPCQMTMFVHDIKSHPAKFNLYENTKMLFEVGFRKLAMKKSDQIILLSENSYHMFESSYPSLFSKATWMPLGAHVPETEAVRPAELGQAQDKGYCLFFGRISRYKGVVNLLRAFELLRDEEKPLLIIAGSGALDEEEKTLISKNSRVLPIIRFIEDGEMLYLIQNARTVILPYIEASQSGVIPIAYHFGVPVITSDVQGLTEFVVNGETGLICSNVEEMKGAILAITDDRLHMKLCKGASRYYLERLNWEKNLSRCIEERSSCCV